MSRTILVTGARKGIGRAIAHRIARDGFGVVVHYHGDGEGAEETLSFIRRHGGSGRIMRFDLADRQECRVRIESDIAEHGAYYGVILNAGLARDNAFPGLEEAEWDTSLILDLGGFSTGLPLMVIRLLWGRWAAESCRFPLSPELWG